MTAEDAQAAVCAGCRAVACRRRNVAVRADGISSTRHFLSSVTPQARFARFWPGSSLGLWGSLAETIQSNSSGIAPPPHSKEHQRANVPNVKFNDGRSIPQLGYGVAGWRRGSRLLWALPWHRLPPHRHRCYLRQRGGRRRRAVEFRRGSRRHLPHHRCGTPTRLRERFEAFEASLSKAGHRPR